MREDEEEEETGPVHCLVFLIFFYFYFVGLRRRGLPPSRSSFQETKVPATKEPRHCT